MKVEIRDDFDLKKIVYSGQCFRPRCLDENRYMFVHKGKTVIVDDSLKDKGVFEFSCSEEDWKSTWYDYFDLGCDYSKIRKSIPKDDIFAIESAELGKGIRILKQDKFEMLISFIISQRKSIPAIRSSIEKLCLMFGEKSDCEELYAFPTPQRLSKATEEELADCGLGYRVSYVLNAAKAVSDGLLDLEGIDALPDEELFEKIKSLYGVGNKVASCVLLFAYHRTGFAPVDTWILKVIDSKYNGVNPFGRYGDTAGIIQQYMFYNCISNR